MRKKSAYWIVVGTLSLGLVGVLPAIGFANYFGSSGTAGVGGTTNGVWFTNNDNFVVGKRVLTFSYDTSINAAAIDFEKDGSDFFTSTVTASSCSDAAYDACAYDDFYGDNGYYGWNSCWGSTSGAHPNQQCSVTWARFNLTYNSSRWMHLGCHELGHGIGIRHNSIGNSCVESGGTSVSLSSHDRGHLALQYP